MGRKPCCDKMGLKRGPWNAEEDEILVNYINKNGGHGSWRSLPNLAGLLRCGKSCRLRWTNYLRPDIKRGSFTLEEEKLIIQLHGILGNSYIVKQESEKATRWAAIASQLPGRTDNEIKNLWNTHLKKRLICMGLDPQTHQPLASPHNLKDKAHASSTSTRHMAQWESARLEAEARFSREPYFNNKTDSDYFLRIWNSEVGESFRDVHKSESSIKCESLSATTTTTTTDLASSTPASIVKKEFLWGVKKIVSDSSSSSSELEHDSCDTSLQLLLDFPINNDMSFLEL